MTHPYLSLSRAVQRRRDARTVRDVQANPHIARDIGQPYRPQPARRIDLW